MNNFKFIHGTCSLLKWQKMITVSVAVVKPKTLLDFVVSNKAVSQKKMKLLKSLSDQLFLLASDVLFQHWPILNWNGSKCPL